MKVKSVKHIGKHQVYDLSVDEAEHYVLENGVVTHNTGGIYASNAIWIISKSQEKDGTDLVGFNFTINIEKSRTVVERSKIPITVKFDSGIEKYSGMLELALESGIVQKPSNGWYSIVDQDTGELGPKKRAADTGTDDFLGKVLQMPAFQEFIKKRYVLTYSQNTKDTDVEESTQSFDYESED